MCTHPRAPTYIKWDITGAQYTSEHHTQPFIEVAIFPSLGRNGLCWETCPSEWEEKSQVDEELGRGRN